MKETSPWKLGGLTVKELASRVWAEANGDDVWGRAAQLAYYFLLALFPLLLFVISMLGVFAAENSTLRQSLLEYLGRVMPADASQLIATTINDVSQGAGGGKLSFGILAALWAASNGMGALSETLNIAYDVEESRPWWKVRLIAIVLTITLSVLIITALIGVLYGHDIGEVIARSFRLGEAFEWTWKIIQYPIIIGFVLLSFALIYYFAPDLKDHKWYWVTPGSVIGVVLWLLVSLAFSLYLNYFNTYSATYGSLGAVIILMLWFYLTGLAILIGGEINSEIERAAAERGDPKAKLPGEKKSPDQKAKDGEDPSRDANTNVNRDARSSLNETSNNEARESADAIKTKTTVRAAVSDGETNDAAAAEKPGILRGALVLGAGWLLSKVGLVDLNKRRRRR